MSRNCQDNPTFSYEVSDIFLKHKIRKHYVTNITDDGEQEKHFKGFCGLKVFFPILSVAFQQSEFNAFLKANQDLRIPF